MRKPILILCILNAMLVLSMFALACGQGNGSSYSSLVAFEALLADPQQYADQYVCTEGVRVEGFEASGLAAAMLEKDGHPQLAGPVIWLESADLQSREDCICTNTTPAFEFCQAAVCGVFEVDGGYGQGGAYAYQMRGHEL